MNRRHLLCNSHWLWSATWVPTLSLLCLGEQDWYCLLQCPVSDSFSTFHGREQSPESGTRLLAQGRLRHS